MVYSLVTGGAGFIGCHVARECLALGHKVVILDNLSEGKKANLPDGIIFIEGSITDVGLINQLFIDYDFDYIYHLAAHASVGLSHQIRHHNYEVNILGSVNLINAAINHNIKCFVFTSSTAVYGDASSILSEENNPHPSDPYGIAKYAIELDLMAANQRFGLNYVIFRPHNVYGEFQNFHTPYRNVIAIFIRNLLLGLPLPVFSRGEQKRSFTYVKDISPIIANSVNIQNAYNQLINIGNDQTFTIMELIEILEKISHISPTIQFVDFQSGPMYNLIDHSKSKKIFNIKQTTLEEGLVFTLEWYKKQDLKGQAPRYNIEIFAGLPEIWTNEEL